MTSMSEFQPQAPTGAPSNAQLLAPVGLLIAGLVGLIGGLLPWVSVNMTVGGGISQSIQGSSVLPGSTNGRAGVAVAIAAFILACAAAYLFGRRNRRLLGVLTVLSLLLLGFGVYNIVDVYRQANDIYNQMDSAFANVPVSATAGFTFNARALFHIDPAPGLWMVAIAGLLGTVLSLFVWIRKQAAPVAEPAAPVAEPAAPVAEPAQPAPPAESPVQEP
jgi:hypothetical protein